ncbi:unnamed protein product [Hymenolepis diminuta]|uniref:Uncharacterized protein n=1 Tax=Hymenolepis diminuta TaxID=6216 RepID=A0A564YC10_HYMDI|nr:unnamed protein product [Hymenolepis diminuta]
MCLQLASSHFSESKRIFMSTKILLITEYAKRPARSVARPHFPEHSEAREIPSVSLCSTVNSINFST